MSENELMDYSLLASSEAEQMVLGAILIDNHASDMLADLPAEKFFFEPNRLIFKTAKHPMKDGLKIYPVVNGSNLRFNGIYPKRYARVFPSQEMRSVMKFTALLSIF